MQMRSNELQQEKPFRDPTITNTPSFPALQHSPHAEQYNNFTRPFQHLVTTDLPRKLNQLNIQIAPDSSQTEIQVLAVKASPNYEIIEVQIKIKDYVLSLKLIILEGRSPLHRHCFDEGSFGKLYKYMDADNRLRAVKCLEIRNTFSFERELLSVLLEYGYMKIASALECAPYTEFGSFDIMVYMGVANEEGDGQNGRCIQFEMQFCERDHQMTKKEQEQLFASLYILHSAGIVHADIKPSNILFSSLYNKWIFIDYGISLSPKQKPGHQTSTAFRGTLEFSGDQMKALYPDKLGPVDLYWNDVIGLQLSIPIFFKKRHFLKEQALPLEHYLKQHLLLIELKASLYHYSFPKIKKTASLIQWNRHNKLNIFSFLLSLNFLPREAKDFFRELCDWESISSLGSVSPVQIFGKITCDISFSEFVDYSCEDDPKTSKYKQIYKNLLILQAESVKNELLASIIRQRQRKKVEQILSTPQAAARLSLELYVRLLFSFVNFLESTKAEQNQSISIQRKNQLCSIFQQMFSPQDHKINEEETPFVKEQGLQQFESIGYFLGKAVETCLHTSEQSLKDILVEVYINNLMLGLYSTKNIIDMYKSILKLGKNVNERCQLFCLVHQNRLWYEGVVSLTTDIDCLAIRRCVREVMEAISMGFTVDELQGHSCSNELGDDNRKHEAAVLQPLQLCPQREQYLLSVIYSRSKIGGNYTQDLYERLSKYEFVLSKLKRNLKTRVIQYKTTQSRSVQSHRNQPVNIYRQWSIPLNVAFLFNYDLSNLNSLSYISATKHLRALIGLPRVTDRWSISFFADFLQLLMKDQRILKNMEIKTFETRISNIYCDLSMEVDAHFFYLQSIYKVRRFMAEEYYLFNAGKKLTMRLMGLCSELLNTVGNGLSPESIAQYLIEVPLADTLGVWWYIFQINNQKARVLQIMRLYLHGVKKMCCRKKSQLKTLQYIVFANFFVSNIKKQPIEYKESVDSRILSHLQNQQAHQIIFKYVELTTHPGFDSLLNENRRHNRIFSQLRTLLQKYPNLYDWFITRKVRSYVFCCYLTFLIDQQRYQEIVEVFECMGRKVFHYYSKQTHFILFRFRTSIYNYFVTTPNNMVKWAKARQCFLLEAGRRSQPFVLISIFMVFIEFMLSVYGSSQKGGGAYCELPEGEINRILFGSLMLQKSIKTKFKWWDIQIYYRCLFMLQLRKKRNSNYVCIQRRYNFITRLHKKIIEHLLSETATLNDSLNRELLYYASVYRLTLYCHPNVVTAPEDQQSLFLTKFKQKLDKFYRQQKSKNNYVKKALVQQPVQKHQ